MTVANEILTTYDVVKGLLEKYPHLRDSDEKLAANIWLKELGGRLTALNLTGLEMLNIFAQGERLTSLESIGRTRRLVQERNSNLRGEKYLNKQKHQEEVKEIVQKNTL